MVAFEPLQHNFDALSAGVCLNAFQPARATATLPAARSGELNADSVVLGPASVHAPERGTVRALPWACGNKRDRVSMSGAALDGHIRFGAAHHITSRLLLF